MAGVMPQTEQRTARWPALVLTGIATCAGSITVQSVSQYALPWQP